MMSPSGNLTISRRITGHSVPFIRPSSGPGRSTTLCLRPWALSWAPCPPVRESRSLRPEGRLTPWCHHNLPGRGCTPVSLNETHGTMLSTLKGGAVPRAWKTVGRRHHSMQRQKGTFVASRRSSQTRALSRLPQSLGLVAVALWAAESRRVFLGFLRRYPRASHRAL